MSLQCTVTAVWNKTVLPLGLIVGDRLKKQIKIKKLKIEGRVKISGSFQLSHGLFIRRYQDFCLYLFLFSIFGGILDDLSLSQPYAIFRNVNLIPQSFSHLIPF